VSGNVTEPGREDQEGRVITKFRLFSYHNDWFGLEPWIIGVPEGSKEEWLETLAAIKKGKKIHFKRLEAVPLSSGNIRWSSPRNSNGSVVEMPEDQVQSFLAQAYECLNRRYDKDGNEIG
jgi:hypothetical protein